MGNIVHISESTSLALHSLAYMALHTEKRINVKQLAGILGASEAHLAKVFQRLVREGLVKSSRGPQGGFFLARSPEEVNLFEVYEALEGPIRKDQCPLGRSKCPFNECMLGDFVHKTNEQFREQLSSRSLADFLTQNYRNDRGEIIRKGGE